MRKHLVATIIFICSWSILWAQNSKPTVPIVKTYSSNGKYYVECIPYDAIEPSLKGVSKVYNSNNQHLYTINRTLVGLREGGGFLAISNDGSTIAYISPFNNYDNLNELNSVTIYRNAKLVKSYTVEEITSCKSDEERCKLLYYNFDKVVDTKKSNWGTKEYVKVFKEGISEQEMFLNEHPVIVANDRLYITDPRKITHVIDLKTTNIIDNMPFEANFTVIKKLHSMAKTIYEEVEVPYAPDESSFPNLLNGDTTGIELGKVLHKKAVRINDADFKKFRFYHVSLEAYIKRDGSIIIEKLEADKVLPIDSIRHFLKTQKYEANFLPVKINQWYFRHFFWQFRNPSDEQAMHEKQQQDTERALERERRMTQDTIDGNYIPRNLKECFIEMDKMLAPVVKNEMKALKSSGDMMIYHLGLGTGIRNRFGLWGGSRLLKYFQDHSKYKWPVDPEGCSSTILQNYYDWLKGDKDAASKWEKVNPIQKR